MHKATLEADFSKRCGDLFAIIQGQPLPTALSEPRSTPEMHTDTETFFLLVCCIRGLQKRCGQCSFGVITMLLYFKLSKKLK